MDITKWFLENRENIIKIIELEDVQSKNDPCEQPYKSQYAARDILQNCITNLEEYMKNSINTCDSITYLTFLSLSYRLANNFISTEERRSGEEIINSIYEKTELVPHINSFIQQFEESITAVGDVTKVETKLLESDLIESRESQSNTMSWMNALVGILIRIYNTKGMLWASQIINQPQDSSTEIDDPSFLNAIKYLNMSKRLYKKYKFELRKNKSTTVTTKEIGLDYDPPECLDSLLLNYLNYETPYLRYECGLLDIIKKKEAVKLDIFESDYTSTLFLLAQAYGKMSSLSSMKHKSARYCYKTLSRQLNSLKYDPVEWALNAATLSQYYVAEKGFKRARHCIAAAQVILKEAATRPTFCPNSKDSTKNVTENSKPKVIENDSDEDYTKVTTSSDPKTEMDCQKTVDSILEESLDAVLDQMELAKKKESNTTVETSSDKEILTLDKVNEDKPQEVIINKKLLPDPMSESRFWDDDVYEEKRVQAKADIERCWIKYGITILENSFDVFMPDGTSAIGDDIAIKDVNFPEFNLELDAVEKQVTCTYVSTFEDARELFLFIQKQITEARKFYKIDYRCSDAIELICDHSKAFKALSNFECSVERKCCMHKKRIDMLTDLLKVLNQNYYQVACRTMMLEVGEIYSTMMSLKMSLIETGHDNESMKSLKNAKVVALKIRRLAQSGIAMYQQFLDSYRNRDGIMPEIFPEEDIRPILIAFFYMARMHSKILEPDMKDRVANLRKSLEYYEFIVKYCDKHPTAANQMVGELESCRDMAVLLPHKIHKMLGSM